MRELKLELRIEAIQNGLFVTLENKDQLTRELQFTARNFDEVWQQLGFYFLTKSEKITLKVETQK